MFRMYYQAYPVNPADSDIFNSKHSEDFTSFKHSEVGEYWKFKNIGTNLPIVRLKISFCLNQDLQD